MGETFRDGTPMGDVATKLRDAIFVELFGPDNSLGDGPIARRDRFAVLALINNAFTEFSERALTPPPAPEGEREALAGAILRATDKDGDQLFFAGHFNTREAAAELLADAILAAGYRRTP